MNNARLADGLVNVVANLGTGRDKAAMSSYADVQFSSAQLLTMYRTSWVAGRGIRAPAGDATRNWRKWLATAEQITKLEAEEKRLGLKSKVEQAIVSARLFGGSAIYINTGVAEQDAPVKEGEKIITLAVLGCNILQPGPNSTDIFSQYYGKPEYYTVTNSKTSGQVRIHASRLAVFYGNALPVGADSLSSGQWGDSVLKTVYDAVTQRDSTVANIASLVFEAKIDVFKFSGFADLLAAGGDDMLVSRLQTQAAMKGINGAVVLDSQDDYQTKGASFGALPELMTRFQEEAAGAFEMPVTRLFGRSVAGLSGSGDGDERVYYDTISHHQNTQITPALYQLDELLIAQALGSRPPEVFYEWTPLRVITDVERTDNMSRIAAAARALAGTGASEVVPIDALSDAVVNALTESGALPGLEAAIIKYGTLSEQTGFVGGAQE